MAGNQFKVLIVAPYFYPDFGGAENYILQLARRLKKDYGFKIVVITSNTSSSRGYREETVSGIKVYRLPILFKFSNTPINPRWHHQIKQIIRQEKPSIINAHTPVPFMADMAARAAGDTPFILTVHAAKLHKHKSPLFNFVASAYGLLLGRGTLRRAVQIGAVSDYVKSQLPNFAQSKTTNLYNSIDLDEIPSNRVKRKKNRLVFIGNLDKTHAWKGLDLILQAVKILDDKDENVELVVGGDGGAQAHYKEEVERLSIQNNVKFVGHIQGVEKYKLLHSSTAAIMYPSSENDALPTFLLEAWATSTPVIAANIGALSTLIKDDKGVLVSPRDPQALSMGIKNLLSNPELQLKLGENGLKEVSTKFSLDRLASTTEELFIRMVQPRVCLVHNVVAPYRLPIFNELSTKANLKVLFCKPITQDRVWTYDLSSYAFKYKILKGFSLGPIIFNIDALLTLWRTPFDVVIVSNDPDVGPTAICAFIVARLKRKKILGWSQAFDENIHFFSSLAYKEGWLRASARKALSTVVMAYRRFWFKHADHFIVLGKKAQLFLESNGIPKNRITRVGQVMPDVLMPPPTIKVKRSGYTFLYVGYFNERKGIKYLIGAFKLLQNQRARLIIAGSGSNEEELKKLANDDRRISFVGYVEGATKANVYAESDVLILPTLSDSWGLVINEAIYYGLAVICSDGAAASEIIDRNTGLVFQSQNISQLHDAMIDVTHQVKLRKLQEHNSHMQAVSDVKGAVTIYSKAISRALNP